MRECVSWVCKCLALQVCLDVRQWVGGRCPRSAVVLGGLCGLRGGGFRWSLLVEWPMSVVHLPIVQIMHCPGQQEKHVFCSASKTFVASTMYFFLNATEKLLI